MTRRDLPPRVPVTVLRVYEPLEAFPPHRRSMLRAVTTDPPPVSGVEEAERRAVWLRLLDRPVPDPDGWTRTLRMEGAVLVSPTPPEGEDRPGSSPAGRPGPDPTERAAAVAGTAEGGAETAAEGDPDPGPRGAAEAPSGPLGSLQGDGRDGGDGVATDQVPARRHTLVRAWDLPVAWLTVVRQEDAARSGDPGRYLLPMSRARARAARALRTLRSGLGEVDVTADTEGLARWLEGFHPRSWVEVDTRLVAGLVGGEDGVEDVRLGLECLTVGDAAGLAAAYQRLRRRSRRLEELSLSS